MYALERAQHDAFQTQIHMPIAEIIFFFFFNILRGASPSSCRSCPSSSWLLCRLSVKSWSKAPPTASAIGRELKKKKKRFYSLPELSQRIFFVTWAGRQATRRSGWRSTWRWPTTWPSTSPKTPTTGTSSAWRRRWKRIISPTCVTIAGKRNSKVRSKLNKPGTR